MMKILASSVALLSYLSCYYSPPLNIVYQDDSQATVHMETLGEYPTTISRIRISTPESVVVFELLAEKSPPQIWRFDLRSGYNPVRLEKLPERAAYRVIWPLESDSFLLETNTEYTVEIWGEDAEQHSRAAPLLFKASD